MSIKDITIVITSFRSKIKIRKCLNSIDKECAVINIENSNDIEFQKTIEKEFNNVKCILSGSNFGYGKGNNIGLNEVKTKYALILNPDTELYPETLEAFLLSAKKNPDFAWLKDVSSVPLQQSLKHLDKGFKSFFKFFLLVNSLERKANIFKCVGW